MSADTNNDANAGKKITPEQLKGLLDKLLGFARTAEAVAKRLVGKVRALSLLGLLAAGWLTYACVVTFDLSLATALVIAIVLFIAPLLLWKLYGTLNSTIGLPQRVTDTAARVMSKANEYRAYYQSLPQSGVDPDQSKSKPTLRKLWQTGKTLLEAKSLGGEAQELVAQAGGALVLTNPLFAIVLGIASAASLLLLLAAAIVGLAFLF